ncbi:MAG TPA: hypothetical protein VGF98_04935 [Candidatus Tumulicola sp.]
MRTLCLSFVGLFTAAAILALNACSSNQIVAPSAPGLASPTPTATPLTLDGETFVGTSIKFSCRASGGRTKQFETIRFHVSGTAQGPLPGTFQAKGVAVYALYLSAPPGFLTLNETFSVTSGANAFDGTATANNLNYYDTVCYPKDGGMKIPHISFLFAPVKQKGASTLDLKTATFSQKFYSS